MTTKRRKAEIERLKEEGREAYLSGVKRGSCPHGPVDGMHWLEGFDQAMIEESDRAERLERAQRAQGGYALRLQLANAIHEHASTNSEFSLQRLMTSLEEWEEHIIERATKESQNGN